MSKRNRAVEQEAFEPTAALIRQGASRAVDRLRLQRGQQQRSSSTPNPCESVVAQQLGGGAARVPGGLRPIDILVIQFTMHYLDLSTVPPTHYVRLAQEVITASADRVLLPRVFARVSLTMLCEGLVAEHTADALQDTLREVEEYVEVRDALGQWIAEESGSPESVAELDDGFMSFDSPKEEGDNHGRGLSFLDLAASLYRSLEYWLRVQTFMHALSLGSANAHAFTGLKPKYERELMLQLHNLSATPFSPATTTGPSSPRMVTPASSRLAVKDEDGAAGVAVVKAEVEDEDLIPARGSFLYERASGVSDAEAADPGPSSFDGDAQYRRDVATAVLADTFALSNCPADGQTGMSAVTVPASTLGKLKGVRPAFYAMIHARLGAMVARDRLQQFSLTASVSPPALTVMQRNLHEHELARQAGLAAAAAQGDVSSAGVLGIPLDYVPDDQYYRRLLEQQHEDPLGEDEEVYKDEVVDYYLRHPQQADSAEGSTGDPRRRYNKSNARPSQAPDALVKPHRYCRVKTGFTWTQYNRTHYDSRTNPPPRAVLWYEFTLFYPALVNTTRDMRSIFRIEDTPKGPDDTYCLLVFSVGQPYADVAYRIVKKQWDTRRGGVRISFDASGKYKLFFRFTNSNYRR